MWVSASKCGHRYFDTYSGVDDGYGNIIWPLDFNFYMGMKFMSTFMEYH